MRLESTVMIEHIRALSFHNHINLEYISTQKCGMSSIFGYFLMHFRRLCDIRYTCKTRQINIREVSLYRLGFLFAEDGKN